MDKLLLKYLRRQKISLEHGEFLLQLKSHSNYPTLLSVFDALEFFGVDSFIGTLDNENFDSLPDHFMCMYEDKLSLVQKKSAEQISVETLQETETIDKKTFLNKWSNIVLVTDSEKVSFSKVNQILYFLLFLTGFFLIPVSSYVFYCTSAIGMFLSLEILKKANGLDSNLSSQLCTISASFDCSKVINFKDHSLSKKLNLPKLCIYYFLFSFLLFVVSFQVDNFYLYNHFKYFFSFLVAPILLYSIYVQAFVIKKMCMLCLLISTVLVIESVFAIVQIGAIDLSQMSLTNVGYFFALLTGTILLNNLFDFRMVQAKELSDQKLKFSKFKNDYASFDHALKENNRQIATTNIPAFELGNLKSETSLTFVTNVFCNYCKEIPTIVKRVLNSDYHVKINFLLFADINMIDEETKRIYSILMNLYEEDKLSFIEGLISWYDKKDIKTWIKKYEKYDVERPLDFYKEQFVWINENDINFTPDLFINQNSFPKKYDKNDLFLFLDHIIAKSA